MEYTVAREFIKTGDVVGCEGKSIIQLMIRKATGQSFNHIAMFVWIETGLYVFEFVEGTGFQFKPASVWIQDRLKKKEFLYWGKAPSIIFENEKKILDHVTTIREGKKHDRNYNYWELPVLWASQYFGFNVEALSGVCSTSIAKAWEEAGYKWKKSPRPGDYMHVCDNFTLISRFKREG